ncbi:hypothetical protein BC628DRAFT_1424366 [Trametes gibbosa]|nr:hypothetical protein BC628DRAFT_1424366 [Trametes gibbosa]
MQSAVNTLDSARQFWSTLKMQFSRTSITSAVTWFRSLVTPLSSIANLEPHIQAFQEAVAHIKSSGFDIPETISSGLFLSTLVDIEGEQTQWLTFTAKFTLTETTTLNSTLADVRNERRRVVGIRPPGSQTDSAMAVDRAYATLENDHRSRGSKWCRYCKREGHWGSECRSKGNTGSSKKRRGKGKNKDKDKSNVTKESSPSSESGEEQSHFVRNERVLYTSFGQYDSHETDLAFVSRSSIGQVIIDSGTSSHVHSNKSDFVRVRSTNSTIRGFGDGKTPVAGRGEAQLMARLPDFGCTRLRLSDM